MAKKLNDDAIFGVLALAPDPVLKGTLSRGFYSRAPKCVTTFNLFTFFRADLRDGPLFSWRGGGG